MPTLSEYFYSVVGAAIGIEERAVAYLHQSAVKRMRMSLISGQKDWPN